MVPGLGYEPCFVAADEEARLIAAADAEPWRTDLKRRVQHYGYRYDYKARRVDPSMYLGPSRTGPEPWPIGWWRTGT